jgi:hypothetical protein
MPLTGKEVNATSNFVAEFILTIVKALWFNTEGSLRFLYESRFLKWEAGLRAGLPADSASSGAKEPVELPVLGK